MDIMLCLTPLNPVQLRQKCQKWIALWAVNLLVCSYMFFTTQFSTNGGWRFVGEKWQNFLTHGWYISVLLQCNLELHLSLQHLFNKITNSEVQSCQKRIFLPIWAQNNCISRNEWCSLKVNLNWWNPGTHGAWSIEGKKNRTAEWSWKA